MNNAIITRLIFGLIFLVFSSICAHGQNALVAASCATIAGGTPVPSCEIDASAAPFSTSTISLEIAGTCSGGQLISAFQFAEASCTTGHHLRVAGYGGNQSTFSGYGCPVDPEQYQYGSVTAVSTIVNSLFQPSAQAISDETCFGTSFESAPGSILVFSVGSPC